MAHSEVTGAKEAMRELRKIEPALARQAVKDIKTAAEPLRAALVAGTPNPPLSGLPRGARATTNYGGRARKTGETVLVKVRFMGPKWTAAADMARTDRRPGGTFARNLSAKLGGPSRWVWPTAERHRPRVLGAVQRAVEAVEDTVNRELGR